jgi:peptidoglycan hydrolase-like protein with peptidoglycan-binding domain
MEAILAESPEAAAASSAATETVPDAALVTEIQRELARLGLYRDTIDGLLGAHTQAAIAAYQTAAGLPRTGLATPELLSIMRHPLPARGQPAVADPARDAEAAALDMRERQRAEKIAAEKQAVAETQARANTRIVQSALNRIGYGPLTVDGDASEATADAIRRFELDNGLPITGTPSDALVGRLVAIGAVKSG